MRVLGGEALSPLSGAGALKAGVTVWSRGVGGSGPEEDKSWAPRTEPGASREEEECAPSLLQTPRN